MTEQQTPRVQSLTRNYDLNAPEVVADLRVVDAAGRIHVVPMSQKQLAVLTRRCTNRLTSVLLEESPTTPKGKDKAMRLHLLNAHDSEPGPYNPVDMHERAFPECGFEVVGP